MFRLLETVRKLGESKSCTIMTWAKLFLQRNIWVYFGLGELCWTTYILQAVTRFIGHYENDSFLRSFFFISTFQAMYIFATSRHFLHIVWKKRCLFLRGGTTNHVVKKLLDQKMSLTKVVGNFTY